MKRRFLSTLLALCMVLTLLPIKAWAAESRTTPKDPSVTELTVTYSDGGTDKTMPLLPAESNQPQIPLPADGQLTFQIGFANWDQLDKVYVTSTKDNSTKYIEAVGSGTVGHYIASGCFDPDDTSYVPGKISVEYTKKTDNVKISDNVDWSTLQAALKDYCTTTVNSASGEAVQATVDISKLLNAEKDVAINVAIDVFDETTGGSLNDWLGYYHDLESMQKRVLEGGNYYLYLDDTNLSSYVFMVIRDVSGSKYTKLVLDEAGEYVDSLVKVAENLDNVNLVNGVIYDCLDIKKSASDLRAEIASNSTISVSQKQQLNAEVDVYESDRQAFTLLMSTLPVLVAATGGTMAGPAIVFSALLSAINAAADTFWDYRIGMIQGCEPVDANFVGSACGVPLTKNYLINNDITQSGQYYLPEGAIGVEVGVSDGTPIDVTLCLHGQKVLSSIRVADGSTLHLCDCMYSENADGSVVGGQVPNVHIGTDSKLVFSSGIIGDGIYGNRLYSNGGEVTITGGTISDSVTGTNGSKIIIEGGTIQGGISSEDGGEIIIDKGSILGTAHGYGCSVWTDNGNIKIYDGLLLWGISTNNGSIYIAGGLIGQDDTTRIKYVRNEAGELEICGGTILGSVYNGENAVAHISGGEVICTRVDSDNTAGDYYAITNDGGEITITGGDFKGIGGGSSNKGTLCMINKAGSIAIIRGGTFYSSEDICIKNGGEMNITGGSFLSYDESISNNGGLVTIHGGQFQSKDSVCVSNSFGAVTISSGYFQGTYAISDYRSEGNTLLIAADSIIEMDATKAVFHSDSGAEIAVKAKEDYSGDVTYYSSADTTGTKMTIEEAVEIDYTQPYICLVADEAAGGPSGGNQEECEHNYTSVVTAPTCIERGYTAYTCNQCGDAYRDNYTDALGHSYGEWVVTATATSITAGQRERICSRCNNRETEIIPATGGGSSSGGSSGGSSSGGSFSNSNYSINTPTRMTGGSIQVSSSSARRGATVTITATPNSGYKLDSLTVTDVSGNRIQTTSVGDDKYTFTMPSSKVTVDASFAAITETPTTPVTVSFTDIQSGAYYADAVAWAVEKGITAGTSTTTFSPNDSCTRAQIVTFLWRAAGSPKATASSPFTDVTVDSYYYDAVLWAVEQGITSGTSATTFSPNDSCTRAQAVTFLYRYEKSPVISGGNAFTDVVADTYYSNAVQWAVDKGVTAGTSATTFSPDATCTRGQIVTFLYRDMA